MELNYIWPYVKSWIHDRRWYCQMQSLCQTVFRIRPMQFIHNNQQMDSYPNLYIAMPFLFLMTMTATVAAGERSFYN